METSSETVFFGEAPPAVRVHAMVLLHVYDMQTRKGRASGRVIGALVGEKREQDGAIEVTDCFPLPLSSDTPDLRAIERFLDTWTSLHSRVFAREQVVGWYCSCDDGVSITPWASDVHDVLRAKCERSKVDPVLVVVDTAPAPGRGDALGVKAFGVKRVDLSTGQHIATAFSQLESRVATSDAEKQVLQMLSDSMGDDAGAMLEEVAPEEEDSVPPQVLRAPMATPQQSLMRAFVRLHAMVGKVLEYVDEVVEGGREPDGEVCAALQDAMALLAPPARYEEAHNDKIRDLLTVQYLTALTRASASISEKLQILI